jgi:serine/threonine-protein kinase
LYPDDSGFCHSDGGELGDVRQVQPPSTTGDARVGQVLGERYQVFRIVADGGMGRVYEGYDQHTGRHVALKILHPEIVLDSVSVERFKREWEVSRMVPHRHIVEVVDFFPIADGSYVLVMEFLVGEELRATLKREEMLPPGRVVRLLSQLALALDGAHQQKLVHRDLKPENIYLCQSAEGDTAKVLDFGSVKNRARDTKQLTVMGTTIGSPFYMSPEQAQALATLDQRADVWSLAAVCYECLTGMVPFSGPNGPSILVQILTKQPRPPSELTLGSRYAMPSSVDRALLRGLSKTAVSRTPSVGKLADELGAAYGLLGTHAAWAVTPEAALTAEIQRALPELLALGALPKDAEEATIDGFFGEEAALGDGISRAPQPATGRSAVPMPAGLELADDVSLPIEKNRTLTYALAAVVVALAVWVLYLLSS